MRAHEIFEATSYADASRIFARVTGKTPNTLSKEELKDQFRKAMMSGLHPDKGGDTKLSQAFNDAYDVLKRGEVAHPGVDYSASPRWNAGYDFDRDDDSYSQSEEMRRAQEQWRQAKQRKAQQRYPKTPPWAWAGYSGGMADDADIRHEDYTDVNYIKKRMWELSGKSSVEYTIWGYDGHYFRHVTSVYGSPKIFNEMARAMIEWQTSGGSSYSCRAVFVATRNDDEDNGTRKLHLVYADGKFYGTAPLELEYDTFNANPGNDHQFSQYYLPHFLNELRDKGRPDSRTQTDMGLGQSTNQHGFKFETGAFVVHPKYGVGRLLNPASKKGMARVAFMDGQTGNVKTDKLRAATKDEIWAFKYHD